MEKGARGVISRYTQGKPVLSYPISALIRLFESKESKEKIKKIINRYSSDQTRNEWGNLRKVKRDIYFSEMNYRIDADEYFRYHFYNLSDAGRKTYVGETESIEKFLRLADEEEKRILANKYSTYCFLKDYYKRSAIIVHQDSDTQGFQAFCATQKSFFIKPLSLNSGRGVRFVKLNEDENLNRLIEEITVDGSVIVEEPIIQADEMAKFHPQSINTVRIVTVKNGEEIEIVQSSVRLGTGDSIVDNGCLSAAVDTESGIITTPGRVAHGAGLYIIHPDTKKVILGSQIPEWNKLLSLAREVAGKFEKQKVIGWDFAYSVNGWVIVEANSNPGIQILAGNGIGMRDVFERIIN